MDTFWKRLRNRLTISFLPYVGYVVIKVLSWTMRFEEKGDVGTIASYDREGRPFISVFWHGHMLMMPVSSYRRNAKVMVSRHRDGELISRIIRLFGLGSFRGSTTRGALSAMRGGLKALADGYKVVLTPDGPKGPRHTVQLGVIELARQSGAPIIPVIFSATKKKVFSSWDRFIFPYPFSKGVFFYGSPFWVPREVGKEEREIMRRQLEAKMRQMTGKVEHYCETGVWEDDKRA